MSFYRENEVQRLEALRRQSSKHADEIEDRALSLINPASGIANDYLNLFNEIVMLVEQLPTMPELMDDLLAWRPTSYNEYFTRSPLPGSNSAIEVYEKLDRAFRSAFEAIVAELDRQATGVVVAIRRHVRTKGDSDPQGLAELCEKGGASLRETLERAVEIVNHGVEGVARHAQARADRLRAVRQKAIKDLEDFYSKPLWPVEEEDEDTKKAS